MKDTQHDILGTTLTEVIVIMVIVAVVAAILIPAVVRARAGADTIKCANSIRNTTLGIAAFEAQNRSFPTVACASYEDWAIAILPFVEQTPMAFDTAIAPLQLPNLSLATNRPPIFRCPSRSELPSYLDDIPCGSYGMNPILSGRSSGVIPQRHLTALIGELPRDLAMPWIVGPAIPSRQVGVFHQTGTNIGFADGSVRRVMRGEQASVVVDINTSSIVVFEN